MNIDKNKKLIKVIESIPNGRFFRLSYRTEVPLKAEYRNAGWQIFKITTRVARTGINYANIKHKEGESYFRSTRLNWNWSVKNKIKHDNKTANDYLVIVPMTKGECKSYYMITYHNDKVEGFTTQKEIDTMIIKSYENRKGGNIRIINLDNLTDIAYKDILWSK